MAKKKRFNCPLKLEAAKRAVPQIGRMWASPCQQFLLASNGVVKIDKVQIRIPLSCDGGQVVFAHWYKTVDVAVPDVSQYGIVTINESGLLVNVTLKHGLCSATYLRSSTDGFVFSAASTLYNGSLRLAVSWSDGTVSLHGLDLASPDADPCIPWFISEDFRYSKSILSLRWLDYQHLLAGAEGIIKLFRLESVKDKIALHLSEVSTVVVGDTSNAPNVVIRVKRRSAKTEKPYGKSKTKKEEPKEEVHSVNQMTLVHLDDSQLIIYATTGGYVGALHLDLKASELESFPGGAKLHQARGSSTGLWTNDDCVVAAFADGSMQALCVTAEAITPIGKPSFPFTDVKATALVMWNEREHIIQDDVQLKTDSGMRSTITCIPANPSDAFVEGMFGDGGFEKLSTIKKNPVATYKAPGLTCSQVNHLAVIPTGGQFVETFQILQLRLREDEIDFDPEFELPLEAEQLIALENHSEGTPTHAARKLSRIYPSSGHCSVNWGFAGSCLSSDGSMMGLWDGVCGFDIIDFRNRTTAGIDQKVKDALVRLYSACFIGDEANMVVCAYMSKGFVWTGPQPQGLYILLLHCDSDGEWKLAAAQQRHEEKDRFRYNMNSRMDGNVCTVAFQAVDGSKDRFGVNFDCLDTDGSMRPSAAALNCTNFSQGSVPLLHGCTTRFFSHPLLNTLDDGEHEGFVFNITECAVGEPSQTTDGKKWRKRFGA